MPRTSFETPAPAGFRYEVLDSLRGVCACMVVLYHLHPSTLLTSLSVVRNGWLFVDFFFVLSGFVIAASYGQKLATGFGVMRFMALRLGRIYPLHLFVLFLFAAVQLVAGEPRFQGQFSLPDLGLNLLLLQSFGSADRLTWNGPAWSVAAEVWAYLIFALIVSYAAKKTILAFGVIGCVLLPILMLYAGGDFPGNYAQGFARCLYGFSLGVLIHHARTRWPVHVGGVAEVCIVLVVILMASFADLQAIWYAPLVFAGAVFIFADEGGGISKILKNNVFQWLGVLSYGIYMLHIFALARFFDSVAVIETVTGWKLTVPGEMAIAVGEGTFADHIFNELLVLASLMFVVLIAWLGWRLVEVPARQWSRNHWGR